MEGQTVASGSVDVLKVLGAQQIVTHTFADEIEVSPSLLGETDSETILTRIRFHEQGVTYDVIGWNSTNSTLICRRV